MERELFNYIYNSTGNMAVLIDGVDEVSPHYTEEVIQILRILLKTEIRKIWVTSRNSVKVQQLGLLNFLRNPLLCPSISDSRT